MKKEEDVMAHESLQKEPIDHVERHNGTWKFWKVRRYVLVILAVFEFFASSILRVDMSIAIIAMASNTLEKKTEFDWDSKLQGYILSSSFYGYISTLLLGGWLSSRIGGKKVFGIGMGASAVLTIIIPPFARLHVYYLIALRFLGGTFQGLLFTSMHEIWAHWAPPLERSKFATAAYAGYPLGVIFAMATCGVIAERLGWPYIFYIYGVIGLISCILWFAIATDDPADDPKISYAELKYIKQSLCQTNDVYKRISHPWKEIFTSSAVWAIVFAQFSDNWGFITLFTQLPKFMNDVMKYDLEIIGLLSTLPYLLNSIITPAAGYLADYLQIKKILTATKVRKMYTCLGFLGQAICFGLVAFYENSAFIICCLVITVGFHGITTSGYYVNHLDIAPQHASVLLGISWTAGMIPGVVNPIMTGYIVQDGTISQWRIIFIIAAVINIMGVVVYGLFGTGQKQKWAKESENGGPN